MYKNHIILYAARDNASLEDGGTIATANNRILTIRRVVKGNVN